MKIYNNIRNIYKAYTEGIYADTPANRKLGRVGMSYAEYAKKLKEEKEEKAEKKYYILQGEDGEEFMLEESKVSKDKIIELAEQYIKDQINYNGRSIIKFNIQEDTDNWSDEDFDNKQYDWFSFTGKKHGNKVEISIFDYNKGEFLRNDTLKRKIKNLKQQHKRQREKDEKEFKEKFGWLEELDSYLKSKK